MIISNGLQCRVSLPSKLVFTVVVQKGWKLMVKQRKENPKKESNSTLSGLPVSTGGCHCCHGYKITNIYEGLHSSHRHLKKHVCCQVHLNSLKAGGGEGGPCLTATVESWDGTWPRRGHAQQCCVEKHQLKINLKQGAKWRNSQQS